MASAASDRVRQYLGAIVAAGPADPVALAGTVARKASAKYDEWIDDDLLAVDYVRRTLDTEGAWRTTSSLVKLRPRPAPQHCVLTPVTRRSAMAKLSCGTL